MDKKRYDWHVVDKNEKWLLDKNNCNAVVAIVSKSIGEEGKDEGWGVYTRFKKKGVEQFTNEKDATKYAETHLAQGEKEERVQW